MKSTGKRRLEAKTAFEFSQVARVLSEVYYKISMI